MTKGFCFSNDLGQYLLRKIECEPGIIFSERELVSVSSSDFASLKSNKHIAWVQFDYDHDLFFSSVRGDQNNPRHLTRLDDGRYRADPEEAGLDSIIVEEKDIPHYQFDIDKFVEAVSKANKLDEQRNKILDRLWFIGSKDLSGDRVGLFVALNDSAEDLGKELKGLPNSAGRYARYIVVSPFTRVSCQKTKGSLNKINVSHFVFDEAFNGDLKFKLGFLFSEAKAELPQALHLTGRIEAEKHIVSVDNKEGGLTDANFKLLLDMVVALKTTDEGWLATGEGDWQAFRRLKDDFKRTFDGFDFEKFIVNGRKKYRLVIPADAVTYDRAMLKKIKDSGVITDLADKLPIIRKKKEYEV
jgi:hypothetical protein